MGETTIKTDTNPQEKKKVFYFCDGNDPECGRNICYKRTQDRDGCCKTSKVEHAVNFSRNPDGNYVELEKNIMTGRDVFAETSELKECCIPTEMMPITINAENVYLTIYPQDMLKDDGGYLKEGEVK